MEGFVHIGNLKIWYEKKGDSPGAIIFLHHNSGSSAVWESQWEDEAFSNYTLIRLDLPGQGRSSHSLQPEKDYNLPDMAGVLQQVIEQLQVEHYVMATLSLGGNIAGEIAHQLTGCKGFFITGASVISENITPADILLPFEFGSVMFAEVPSEEELKNYLKGLVFSDSEDILANLAAWYRNTDPHLRMTLGKSIAAGKWTDEILHLEVSRKPVILVFGEDERIVNQAYIGKIPGDKWTAGIRILDDAGHLANLDQPEAFNRLLLEFAGEMLKF